MEDGNNPPRTGRWDTQLDLREVRTEPHASDATELISISSGVPVELMIVRYSRRHPKMIMLRNCEWGGVATFFEIEKRSVTCLARVSIERAI